jgi:LemA protein
MVEKDESVEASWADVETQYQRRADLIPNLVATVKGFAQQEKDVLVGVTEARAKATSMNINVDDLDEASLAQYQQAQSELSGALSRLLVSVEAYPELKSDRNFLELQAQLEGTENRISVARNRFNDTARDYNTYIRQFPNSLVANISDFERKPLFQAAPGSENAPKVEF